MGGPRRPIYWAFMPLGRAGIGANNRPICRSAIFRLKEALAELAIAKIAPIGDEMRRLNNDPSAVDAVLADGAERPAPLPSR